MNRTLDSKFFNRPVLKVAKGLLGKYLVRKVGKRIIYAKIIETEAYDGTHDLACHASKGKTERNKIMFGEAGHFYIYFVYGMHYILNIVTGKKDYPAAVLIRGVEIDGKKINGPAKLTKLLKIDKKLNSKQAKEKNGLWFEKGSSPKKIISTPRIGVTYAGPIWSKKPWRFILES